MGSVGRPKGHSAILERRRFLAMALMDAKWSPQKISKDFEINIHTVKSWRNKYTKHGFHGIASTQATGRPPFIEKQRLKEFFDETINQFRGEESYITTARMQDLIKERFHLKCSKATVRTWLKKCGWSAINGRGFFPPKE